MQRVWSTYLEPKWRDSSYADGKPPTQVSSVAVQVWFSFFRFTHTQTLPFFLLVVVSRVRPRWTHRKYLFILFLRFLSFFLSFFLWNFFYLRSTHLLAIFLLLQQLLSSRFSGCPFNLLKRCVYKVHACRCQERRVRATKCTLCILVITGSWFVHLLALARNNTHLPRRTDGTPVSLSVNYLPTKFSNNFMLGASRNRKDGKGANLLPKRGGGVEAFRSGEARMPGEHDEDYDGIQGGLFGGKEGGHTKPQLRWNKFKWTLFVANLFVSVNSILLCCVV